MTETPFKAEMVRDIEQYATQFEDRHSAILPSLWLIQNQYGYVSDFQMTELANLIGVHRAEVEAIATFYDMIQRTATGRFNLRLCVNASCSMAGGRSLYRCLIDRLGLHEKRVTEDGIFSVTPVECIGACDQAPVIQIGREYFHKMTETRVNRLLQKLKDGESVERLAESFRKEGAA